MKFNLKYIYLSPCIIAFWNSDTNHRLSRITKSSLKWQNSTLAVTLRIPNWSKLIASRLWRTVCPCTRIEYSVQVIFNKELLFIYNRVSKCIHHWYWNIKNCYSVCIYNDQLSLCLLFIEVIRSFFCYTSGRQSDFVIKLNTFFWPRYKFVLVIGLCSNQSQKINVQPCFLISQHH